MFQIEDFPEELRDRIEVAKESFGVDRDSDFLKKAIALALLVGCYVDGEKTICISKPHKEEETPSDNERPLVIALSKF